MIKNNSSDSGPLGIRKGRAREFGPEEAKRFYDRFGVKQDKQFYERRPLRDLLSYADFEHASSVFELGCGTGGFATCLLGERLDPHARYAGIDISTTMVAIALSRLAGWSDRVAVEQADGTLKLPYPDGQFDRFVATYVFDLLPLSSIGSVLDEAHRLLGRDGKLCVVSSTAGTSPVSRIITRAWKALYEWSPGLVGGCRPLQLSKLLPTTAWRMEYVQSLSSCGIASEIVVASRVVREVVDNHPIDG